MKVSLLEGHGRALVQPSELNLGDRDTKDRLGGNHECARLSLPSHVP